MYSSASRYEQFRCKLIDKQGQEFIEKTNQLIFKVKDTLTNPDLSRQRCDEAVEKALKFFSQQFPKIGDEEQPKNVDNGNSSSHSDLREEISDLKRDVSKLKRTLAQEREKTKKPAAKHQKMQSAGVPPGTIDDEKVFQAAPKPFKFPAPAETHLDVVLHSKEGCNIKKPGETDAIQGMLICSSSIIVIKTGTDNKSHIMLYDFHGKDVFTLQTLNGLWAIKSLHDNTVTIFNGSYVLEWSKASLSQPWLYRTLFKRTEGDILGVADLKSKPADMTVATKNRILLVKDGEVYAKFSIPEPPKDVFSIDRETLMVFDASGFLKINVHTKKSVRIVPQIKTLDSLASWIHGCFFALDIANKSLYLFGSDMKKVRQAWSLENLLRDRDELQNLCVSETKCLCLTKFGSVLQFDIKFEKKQW